MYIKLNKVINNEEEQPATNFNYVVDEILQTTVAPPTG
jgi:hypothetical protein